MPRVQKKVVKQNKQTNKAGFENSASVCWLFTLTLSPPLDLSAASSSFSLSVCVS